MKQFSIKYGRRKIFYSVIYTNRKTLEIAVHPDCSVVVTAPRNSNREAIREKVRLRSKWIVKQIDYFKQFEPRTPPRQYLNGESHFYLGKRYRLKLKTDLRESVALKRGFFVVSLRETENRKKVKEILYRWYEEKAKEKFTEIFEDFWNDFRLPDSRKPNLRIRKMKTRWGSLSPNGTLTVNIELIKAPKESIEYVIAHELCHVVHRSHGRKFYELLSAVMPDWYERKNKLEMMMA